MSIYIGNLSYEVSSEDLKEVFNEYGTVQRVHIPTDRETGRSRGFGFVEMQTESEEEVAIETLDEAQWMGRSLKVNKARPRDNRNSSRGGRNNRF
jgi:RNA recognition motif-containing protein